jgi:hypothetical protein
MSGQAIDPKRLTLPPTFIGLVRLSCLATILLLVFCRVSFSDQSAAAARYCAQYNNTITLSEDYNILCLDGRIGKDLDESIFNRMNHGGFFVIRSDGGNIISAMKIANILLEKDATTVIYDYCLSACANAIFVASQRTHVLGSAIVAWHRGLPRLSCAPPPVIIGADEKEHREYQEHLNGLKEYCSNRNMTADFYKRRGIDDRFTHAPQTPYATKMFRLIIGQATNKDVIFWMWNPRNFGEYFKSRITFQSFPESQDHVNELVRRLRLPIRVVFDPPADSR